MLLYYSINWLKIIYLFVHFNLFQTYYHLTSPSNHIYSITSPLSPFIISIQYNDCIGAAAWRIVLLPLDAAKTSLQVNGEKGLQVLKEKVQLEGIQGLFAGALAGSAATFVGHYPWFLTYNYLSDKLPTAQDVIGYIHVMTSDIAVNTAKTLELQGSDLDVLITAPVLAHFPVDLTVYSSVISHLLTVSAMLWYW